MKFRPLHDRVVVKRIDAEEKSAGGIIIPDTAKEKPQQGEVVAVGPGGRDETGKLIPIDVKAGDRVLFGKWSGTEVKIDGIEYLIMKESDIMGVFDESDRAQSQAYALSVRAQIAIILIFLGVVGGAVLLVGRPWTPAIDHAPLRWKESSSQ